MSIIKTKEDLFGSVKKPEKRKATHDHQVDVQVIKKLWTPIEGHGTIMYYFCTGCGNLVSVTPDFAEVLARSVGKQVPQEPKKFYFKSGVCGECDSQNDTLELLPIPQMNA